MTQSHTPPHEPSGLVVQGGPTPGLANQQTPYLPVPYPSAPPKLRGTGVSILLTVVTFGIYQYFYYYGVHEEMKRHKGTGIGGVLALVLSFFVGIAMPYVTSSEVGELYERSGLAKPVSGLTGLWFFPGIFLLGLGPIIWFVKTNGALNDFWRMQGVR